MTRLRAMLLPLFLAIPAAAADLPQGALPNVDGLVEEAEWANSFKMPIPHGTARLRAAGRVLCIAVEVDRPYAGERIDLRTSDPAGDLLTLIQLHPGCYLPRPPFSALPPTMVRRSRWDERAVARYAVPYSMRFRARILQKDAKSWSAEFCVALEALDLPIGKPAVFNLTTSHPFTGVNRPLSTPPSKWEPLNAAWDPTAGLYVTPTEDKVNAWAQELFREALDRARGVDPSTPVLGAAFDEQMDETNIKGLIEASKLEIEAAPWQYHGLWYRLHILRRANRLKDADAAYLDLIERLPKAQRLEPVVQERNAALLAERRFDEWERENRGIAEETTNWVLAMRTAWDLEAARRKDEVEKPGTRLVLTTSRGEIEIALYRFDEPGYDQKLAQWLTDAKLVESEPSWVTGALGVAWGGMPAEARFPSDKPPPLAWRGTASLLGDRTLVLATGPVHITRQGCAIGRIVKGMEHLDAMAASDRILSAKVVPAPARDGAD